MIITSISPVIPSFIAVSPSLSLSLFHYYTPPIASLFTSILSHVSFPSPLYSPSLLSLTSTYPLLCPPSPLHPPSPPSLPLYQRPPNGSVSIGALQDYLQRGHTDAIERKMQYAALLHSNDHQGAVNLLVRVFFSATKVCTEGAYCCDALSL